MTERHSVTERYFDHHSTQPLSKAARAAMAEGLERFGDPLRLHRRGREAWLALEQAREEVAAALSTLPDEIVFTSGGTESVSLALHGSASEGRGRVVVGAAEHPSVLGAVRELAGGGSEIASVPVDEQGRIDVDRFAALVRAPGVAITSVQHANHEIGTIQPVAKAASLAREAGVLFHTDACQTVGRLPVDAPALGVDLLSLSGHKFGAPPGVGALYVRRGVRVAGHPAGDDRDRRGRAGLQNVTVVLAMAAALVEREAGLAEEAGRHWSLTTGLRRGIEELVPGAVLHGHPTQRAPHLVCFSVPAIDPEVLLMALDERGFRLDAGSVVSGSPHEPSTVLAAMGSPDTVGIRASVGPDTTETDVEKLLEALAELVPALTRARASGEADMADGYLKRVRRAERTWRAGG